MANVASVWRPGALPFFWNRKSIENLFGRTNSEDYRKCYKSAIRNTYDMFLLPKCACFVNKKNHTNMRNVIFFDIMKGGRKKNRQGCSVVIYHVIMAQPCVWTVIKELSGSTESPKN